MKNAKITLPSLLTNWNTTKDTIDYAEEIVSDIVYRLENGKINEPELPQAFSDINTYFYTNISILRDINNFIHDAYNKYSSLPIFTEIVEFLYDNALQSQYIALKLSKFHFNIGEQPYILETTSIDTSIIVSRLQIILDKLYKTA